MGCTSGLGHREPPGLLVHTFGTLVLSGSWTATCADLSSSSPALCSSFQGHAEAQDPCESITAGPSCFWPSLRPTSPSPASVPGILNPGIVNASGLGRCGPQGPYMGLGSARNILFPTAAATEAMGPATWRATTLPCTSLGHLSPKELCGSSLMWLHSTPLQPCLLLEGRELFSQWE